jgi:hypothetical protein
VKRRLLNMERMARVETGFADPPAFGNADPEPNP